MDILQKFMSVVFRRQYVLLIHYDGKSNLRNVYKLGDSFYAHPYLPHTRVELLKNGEVNGPSYIKVWKPVTRKTYDLFYDGRM